MPTPGRASTTLERRRAAGRAPPPSPATRGTAEDAMSRGRAVLDRLPDPAHPEHHFVIDPAKADFYAVEVYRGCTPTTPPTSTPSGCGPTPSARTARSRSPMRRSEALLTLGVIAARCGELDAAIAYGLAALGGHYAEPVAAPWRDTVEAIRAQVAVGSGRSYGNCGRSAWYS